MWPARVSNPIHVPDALPTALRGPAVDSEGGMSVVTLRLYGVCPSGRGVVCSRGESVLLTNL